VLLVETRKYYLLRQYPYEHEERGEGLVLHHEDFRDLMTQEALPHVSDDIVRFMRAAAEQASFAGVQPADSLLPADYQDPVARDKNGRWLAAFAPVVVSARSTEAGETGWFVIVQQRQTAAASDD
jgi:hypothetical protein